MSDLEVLSLAKAQHHALVTNNVPDFRPLHSEVITPAVAAITA
jgi:hypothetical protein